LSYPGRPVTSGTAENVEKTKNSVKMLSSGIRMAAEKLNMNRTMGREILVADFDKGKFVEKWSQRSKQKIKSW
jgi:hypothetical protein